MTTFVIRAFSAASLALGIASLAPLPALADSARPHDIGYTQIADNTPTVIQQLFQPSTTPPPPPPNTPPVVTGVRG